MQLLERDYLILQREFNLEYRQSLASAYYVRASPSDVFFWVCRALLLLLWLSFGRRLLELLCGETEALAKTRELTPGAVPRTVTASEEMEVGRERKRHSHRHVDTHGGGGEGVGVRERGGGGSERVREAKDMHYFSLERDRLL